MPAASFADFLHNFFIASASAMETAMPSGLCGDRSFHQAGLLDHVENLRRSDIRPLPPVSSAASSTPRLTTDQ